LRKGSGCGPDDIVATLARQDGIKPRIWNDYFRVREACLAVERQYGLRVTAPGDRTAGRRPTRAENEHARRRGWEEPARTTLRRAVHTAAAGASSEQEFFARLEAAGLLVRKRFSQRDPGQVTGYAVAKPGHLNGQGVPVWFGGGKLAADLTLPKLRQWWLSTGPASTPHARPGVRLSAEERRHIWNGVSNTAARAAHTIRSCAFVAELRDAQRHAAQASAARAAAERLYAVNCAGQSRPRRASPRPTMRPHRRSRTAADLAGLDFPDGAKPPRTVPPGSPRQGPAQAPTPRRASQPRRPRGPSP